MSRVHVFVEGQTEETFVRDVLYEHLQHRGVYLNPILLRTSAQGRGGVVSYGQVRWQVSRKCLEDATANVTSMIDLFRLPNDFPKKQACSGMSLYQRVACLEQAFLGSIECNNFIPYLSVHEFEGLLFSDSTKFGNWFDDHNEVQRFAASVSSFRNPEQVNDGAATAPSKRIAAAFGKAGYQKPVHGPLIAMDIGLERMREACPHFHQWVECLESLAP